MHADEFIDCVQQRGVSAAEISRQEKQHLQLQWRAIFAFHLPRPGRLTTVHRNWHIFSTKQAVCRGGKTAFDLYARVPVTDFFIIPEQDDLPGLRCTASDPPDLSALQLDLYVSSADFSWTMVFTHDHPWHGPYFAQRAWQKIKL
ncbi:MAG: DUF4275 family protein [Candidatus Binatia bacterium]